MRLKNKPLVIRNGNKMTIRHHQTIRQSHDYQSAEVSYGVEFEVDNTPIAIKKGIKKAERVVEEAVAQKYLKQRELLEAISQGRQQ